MNTIVTGGTGFIGSWLIQELIRHGHKVTVIARKRDGLIEEIRNSRQCSIIEKPVEDLRAEDFDGDISYDVCFHLGWGAVSPEKKNNIDFQLNNISMSIKALEVCSEIGCKKFIASGSVAEYVFSNGVIDTEKKQTPNDIYGAAKTSAYYFMKVRAGQLGIPFIWLIIPSTFGGRRKDNNIITYTIKTLLKGEKPSYGNLRQMWDFLYVEEVVRAIRLVGESGRPNKIYGIGSGVYKPLYEYIEVVRDFINPALTLGIGEISAMSEQALDSCVDISELRKDTGFIPKISFEEGIEKTVEYFKNNL